MIIYTITNKNLSVCVCVYVRPREGELVDSGNQAAVCQWSLVYRRGSSVLKKQIRDQSITAKPNTDIWPHETKTAVRGSSVMRINANRTKTNN